MKKVIMFAAIMMMAVATFAIDLQWTIANVGAGSTAYIFNADTTTTDAVVALLEKGGDLSKVAWGNSGVAAIVVARAVSPNLWTAG